MILQIITVVDSPLELLMYGFGIEVYFCIRTCTLPYVSAVEVPERLGWPSLLLKAVRQLPAFPASWRKAHVNLVRPITEHPDQLDLWPRAIEELLRWELNCCCPSNTCMSCNIICLKRYVSSKGSELLTKQSSCDSRAQAIIKGKECDGMLPHIFWHNNMLSDLKPCKPCSVPRINLLTCVCCKSGEHEFGWSRVMPPWSESDYWHPTTPVIFLASRVDISDYGGQAGEGKTFVTAAKSQIHQRGSSHSVLRPACEQLPQCTQACSLQPL